MSDATSGASIYYTTDGSTPTTTSTKYVAAIKVSSTETLKAIAVATGHAASAVASATYTITPITATPIFAPAAGTYTIAQTASISDATSGASIYYTTNGSTPTTSSTKYAAAIKVSSTETLKAIAVAMGHSVSAVASATYTITPVTATPTFSPVAGTYAVAQTVSISDPTSGASIYYTTNGSTPTTTSTKYSGSIRVSSTETLKAIAVATGDSASAAASATYTITPVTATPTLSPAAGTYATAQTVSISDATTGASIYYTTNGMTPTTSSSKYTAAIKVGSTETVKAVAVATGDSASAVASATYTITLVTATPTFSPAAGTYAVAQTVSISDATSGASIYYTTNGSTPTTSSSKYTADIKVSSTETVKAIALATGHSASAVASATYTIAPVPPVTATPTFSPPAGTYDAAQKVSIVDSTGGATVYFTTNGTTPTSSSTKYSAPIAVSSSQTIKAIAIAPGDTYSGVASAAYNINASWRESIIVSFDGTDGRSPNELVMDRAGNLYGTTSDGGANNSGIVFEISSNGAESVLYSFGPTTGTDGSYPQGGLTMDGAGNLYGTTGAGGANDYGTVFKISISGTESILHSFAYVADGQSPQGGVIMDGAGNLYGTTASGGSNNGGTVFKIDASGMESVMYSFQSSGLLDGEGPNSSLILDSVGNLYGTTGLGGDYNAGTVFKISPSRKESVFYSFGSSGQTDGAEPNAGLLMDGAGNLYGTTVEGGTNNTGTVFKISASGAESVVFSFGSSTGTDGRYPTAPVIMDGDGNLYGTTTRGGTHNAGIVFKISASGAESVLYSFGNPPDGEYPEVGRVMDGDGNLYGTTSYGGPGGIPYGNGTVFKLSP